MRKLTATICLIVKKYRMRNVAIIVSFIVCIFDFSTEAATPREIAKLVFPSVAMLLMEDKNGQVISQGSGFFVKPHIIATNFHVIAGASAGYVKIIGRKTLFRVRGVVSVDREHDLALLRVPKVKGPVLRLGSVDLTAVGDKVYAVGNPLGLEGTFSEGIVSGVRNIKGSTIFQITAPISPGSSGGAVVNIKGHVIGVAAATFSRGQNLNFVIPASYLKSLVARKASPVSLASLNAIKRSQSVLNKIGGKNVQGVIGIAFSRGTRWQGGKQNFEFSIRNLLPQPVKNISGYVVFRGKNNEPLDVVKFKYRKVIPPKLAKRIARQTYSSVIGMRKKVEIRIISFDIK